MRWIVVGLIVLAAGVGPWIKNNYGYDRYTYYQAQNETTPVSADDRIANYNYWLTVITGVLAVVAVIQIGFLIRSDRNAKISADAARDAGKAAIESNRINRDAMIADQRPWVAVTVAMAGPMTWNENGVNFPFLVICENTGRTPALNVSIDLRVHGDFSTKAPERQRSLADHVRSRPPYMGFTIFPGKTLSQEISGAIGLAELEWIKADWKNTFGDEYDGIIPVLVGCVTYGCAFDNERRQTGFIRSIRRVRPLNDSLEISRALGDIPLQDLAMFAGLKEGYTN